MSELTNETMIKVSWEVQVTEKYSAELTVEELAGELGIEPEEVIEAMREERLVELINEDGDDLANLETSSDEDDVTERYATTVERCEA